ncbi:putative GTP-binding protein EngB [Clostridia bacterium]|nr:putative GTP-binding protein EngB [Clostridia bacterium]
MVVNNVNLEKVAVNKDNYPAGTNSEIAFVGRSNVGKSSLINTMIYRKALARTSQNPGKTRTINFYNIEDKLYFVDLPGYGYAKTSKSESEKWGKMIEDYLKEREQLRAVVLLIDSRHEPSPLDCQMYDWLSYYGENFDILIAATKTDKLKPNELKRNLSVFTKKFGAALPFSSEKKTGRDELWEILETYI